MKLYISSWSFENEIQRRKLQLEDLPDLAVANGFHGVEIMDRQLPLDDSDYLGRLARRLRRLRCEVVLDISSDLTSKAESRWLEQVDYVRRMLLTATNLGAKRVRVLLGGQALSLQKLYWLTRKKQAARRPAAGLKRRQPVKGWLVNEVAGRLSHAIHRRLPARAPRSGEKADRAIESLREIMPEAERLEVAVAIENHWGISSLPETLVAVVTKVNSTYLGACPDFTNFPRNVDVYHGLEVLAPRAALVHARSRKFTSAGEEKFVDYGRCLRILRRAGFDGAISVEYVGGGDVLAGCVKTGELIRRHWPANSRLSSRKALSE